MKILTQKTYKQYGRISRYMPFPYFYNSLDGKYVYGVTAQLQTKDIPFVAHKVKDRDTLDTLALYYYNNPTYFWIIADFNRIQDPYEKLTVGSIIRIPTFSKVDYEK